jgi:hypothetical protein
MNRIDIKKINTKHIKNIGIILVCLLVLWIINKYYLKFRFDFKKIFSMSGFKEGFDPNALLTYDSNTPETSHSVDVINERYTCANFCGPKAQCAITREQCSTDVDCQGCQPPITEPPKYLTTTEVKPLNDAGKLTWNQTPQYSELTTDIGTFASYVKPGSLDAELTLPYQGYDAWGKPFNYGLKLADEKLAYEFSPQPEKFRFIPEYPVTKTVTGMFYDTGPTASNAKL